MKFVMKMKFLDVQTKRHVTTKKMQQMMMALALIHYVIQIVMKKLVNLQMVTQMVTVYVMTMRSLAVQMIRHTTTTPMLLTTTDHVTIMDTLEMAHV